MKEESRKKAKKAAAATVAAAGLMTGTLFDSPIDLVPEFQDNAVVEDLLDTFGGDSADDGESAPQEKRRGPLAKAREWVQGLPAAVRMLVALPLWSVGWVLSTGLSALIGTVSLPAARIASWICMALVLLFAYGFSVKCAFPEVPFRKIFGPRNLLLLLSVALLLGAADLALPAVWTGYAAATQWVWRIGATCLLAVSCGLALHRYSKEAKTPPAEEAHELTEAEIQAAARRLADTVFADDNRKMV